MSDSDWYVPTSIAISYCSTQNWGEDVIPLLGLPPANSSVSVQNYPSVLLHSVPILDTPPTPTTVIIDTWLMII